MDFDKQSLENLKITGGMIKSLTDIFSFPGSDYLKDEIIQTDLKNLKDSALNNNLLEQFDKLSKIFLYSDKEELQREYSRLFIGPFHVLAPPYGSYYLENGRLMGDSTVEVNNLYNEVGLVLNESFKDLPDHIIAELEFLSFLTFNEENFIKNNDYESYEKVNALKKHFFSEYMIGWVNRFTDEILKNTNHLYYIELVNYAKLCFNYLNMAFFIEKTN